MFSSFMSYPLDYCNCTAYLLVSDTILLIMSGVKNREKSSRGSGEIGTAGPVGCTKGCTSTTEA